MKNSKKILFIGHSGMVTTITTKSFSRTTFLSTLWNLQKKEICCFRVLVATQLMRERKKREKRQKYYYIIARRNAAAFGITMLSKPNNTVQ